MNEDYGPREEFSRQLHATKYRLDGESFEACCYRVASALSDDRKGEGDLAELLLDQRFLPAGRILNAMGTSKETTPYNCYVSGLIPDSFTKTDNPWNSSIMHRATEAATTMRMGGGIGYDFSTLRPSGALIRTLGSASSGPIHFMEIFDAVCRATSSAGNRRGAQMGVLRVDHPDVMNFVRAKTRAGFLEGFNVSVAVTDEFMEHLQSKRPFALRFGGEVYGWVDPEELWEEIMRSTWDWGEPGVLFIDTINRRNNLRYCETIAATNPCGEQPLPAHGACLLGSFNLTKYIMRQPDGSHSFDYDWLEADVPVAVRALDNVVDRARYPLPEQALEARSKRRMGIGVTGVANALEAMGMTYGTSRYVETQSRILHLIQRECYLAGVELAKEKGAFELFDADRYCSGDTHFATLDDDVKLAIRNHGLRNSHYTSIAPTGTISMTADNVSSSIEPVYRWSQKRRVIMPEGPIEVDLYDYGFKNLRVRGRRSAFGEISAREHVAVLTSAQNYVDSAVSKTINCDGSMPWADFKQTYLDAYSLGAKGCTTFNSDGKRSGLFKPSPEPHDLEMPDPSVIVREAGLPVGDLSCTIDPATGRRSCE